MKEKILLRQRNEWAIFGDRETVNRFQYLAHQYGCQATWLPITGGLVTRDEAELNQHFPYEQWLRIALYDGPESA